MEKERHRALLLLAFAAGLWYAFTKVKEAFL